MKRCLQTLFVFITISTAYSQNSDFYSNHWSKVYRYEMKGLPQSALAVVDSIYNKAKRDNEGLELIKALLYQSKFALSIQENAELLVIRKFGQQIANSKPPLRNLLESMLANIYWQYFKENRWKYYERSRTATVTQDDFRTWDADAMFKVMHHHFRNSLENAAMLQDVQLESVNEILVQADNSKKYRPTLYDFLIHNAIDFYSTNESEITTPSNESMIIDEKYFMDFENVSIESADSLSSLRQALTLYQDLLAFHKKRADTTAYVNLELERLNFIAEENDLDQSNALLTSAFTALRKTYRSHPASTLAIFELASLLHTEGSQYDTKNTDVQFKMAEALDLCNEAISLYPKSDGAKKCQGLRERILHKTLSLTAEKYIPINTASFISIHYTNVDSLYFKAWAISQDIEQLLNGSLKDDSTAWSRIATLSPAMKWSVKLKNVSDYQAHTTEIVLPALPHGRYVVLGSPINDHAYNDDLFGYATIQVTNLGLFEYASKEEHHYRVVNRTNGAPVEGAEIHLQTHHGHQQNRRIDEHLTTGKDGEANLTKPTEFAPSLMATVRYQDDEASFGDYYVSASARKANRKEETRARTFLFTDRSIYRPGQVVFFKGILIKTKGDRSSVVAGQYIVVYLEDVNGNEVGSLRLKTNTFGSVSGEFKLPSTGLTGEYSLYADEDDEGDSRFYDDLDDFEYGEHVISVEEYKRPTFEVIFKPVAKAFTLNDSVAVTGVAEAYSGSAVSGSKVTYRVTRQVRYPRWHSWMFDREHHDAAEIAHGETVTGEKGQFSIHFRAIPDTEASPDDKPVFVYEINADVTDITGETRSATIDVKVGYHAVTATINAPGQVDVRKPDNVIRITTENLNGQFVPLKGKLQIIKLKAPDAPVRTRPWEAPDLPLLTEQQFQEQFPHDTYSGSTDSKAWPKQKLLLELPFDTGSSKELKFSTTEGWPLGNYLIELTAIDSGGNVVNDFYYFNVTDSRSKAVADNTLVMFELDKSSYKVGEVARLRVGSASPDLTLFIHVEKNYDVTKTYVEHFSGNSTTILIPVTDDREHGLSVSCSGAAYNSFVYKTINIPVIRTSEQFEIETITFKDKLQTGAKETWSFSIKGADSQPKEAEVLASMYDASLDQFKPHEWSFQPIERSPYFARIYINGRQSFGKQNFDIRNLEYPRVLRPYQYYDQFDWFGFSFTKNSYVQRAYLDRLYSSGVAVDVPSRVVMRNQKRAGAGNIYGRIVDNDGQALPGVNILIKGTTIGTSTDVNGNYVIQADKNDVLVYSFVGYASAEARVERKNTIDVIMEPDITELSEVVVTAYGIQTKKEALAYSVSTVQMEGTGEIVFEEPLEGRVAGVQIVSGYSFYAMNIRGSNSMAGDSQPLYVVDGVVVDAGRIDQSDLASMQVLKGSAATAIYGSKAANGVIIITTKSGQKKMDEELAKVSARKNFNETAFFFPQLSTNEDGNIRFTFTTPESLTRWKLQLLAHTKDLLTTTRTFQTVTQKELMITPNAPRFLRIGDEVVFAVKIANLSARRLNGKVGLELTDAVTGKNVDGLFTNAVRNKAFTINARGNTEISWTLNVPEGVGALQYRVVAKAGNFSDGEQNALPVLSNRTLVTETMPIFVRPSQTKTFTLDKLQNSKSTTLKHHRLTFEATSNPAWYAVQSLPYLMEFPHECAEQLFSRYYANVLAAHIIEANPVIRDVFQKWSSHAALTSNLEKNQELKSLIIEETPWLRDARDESEGNKRLSLLFDLNSMKDHLTAVLHKLKQMQFSNGGFPWFAGAPKPSRYITQHIAVTYGHLKKLQVADHAEEKNMVMRALWYLDGEFIRDYEVLWDEAHRASSKGKDGDKKRLSEEYLSARHVTDQDIHYLYMRSFFEDVKPQEKLNAAIDYYRKQSAAFWQDFNVYSKGMIALIHYRDGNISLAKDIMRSLEENAVKSEELGMYWKENAGGMYWHEAAIETQALLIEAFAEIGSNESGLDAESRKTIDELRLWLLKNKQTTQWKTTKATTEAVYALLMNGTDWLSLDDEVDVAVGTTKVIPDAQHNPEVATGYFKTSWPGEAVTPEMATVTFSKKGEGAAWGGLYWQYFEDLDKVTNAETPLKLTKKIFAVTNTDRGELLTDIDGVDLKPGDLLRVRIELTADRPMEFLHMKDMRAAGLEPVDILSGYKWQETLGYYQSTRDASTNFFFDFVPKGVYVFEYDLRVNNKGNFSNGITTIQSMYAPEFTSHSEGVRVEVR